MQHRLPQPKLVVRAGIRGVDARPRRQDEGERLQRVIRVLLDAAAHPARVVGEDSTHPAGLDRSRVRSHLPAERLQRQVDVGADGAGLDPDVQPALLHRDGVQRPRQIDQDAVGEGERQTQLMAQREELRDLRLRAGEDHRFRDQSVEARVVRMRDALGGRVEHPPFTDDRLEARAKVPSRQAPGRAVGNHAASAAYIG